MRRNSQHKKRSNVCCFVSIVLSVLLCFSMVPFAYANNAVNKDVSDEFEGVPEWVTNIELPTSPDKIDWDSLKPGVDYEDGSMILTFMPKTSLEKARLLLEQQGWEEDGIIAWYDEYGWKSMSVTIPDTQSVKDAMLIASELSSVWYVELNEIAYCPIDEEVTDITDVKNITLLDDETVQKTTQEDSYVIREYSSEYRGYVYYSSKELYLHFNESTSLEEATNTILNMEGWSIGFYDTRVNDDYNLAYWEYDHKIVVTIPSELTVYEAKDAANQQEGITDVSFLYLMTSDSYTQSEPGLDSNVENQDSNNSAVSIDSQWYLDYLGITDAWNYTQCNGSVSVAVLDTGVYAVPDLQTNLDMDNAWDAVTRAPMEGNPIHSHGTWVAGVISAEAGDNRGVSGVSYNANIVPVNIAVGLSEYDAYSNDCVMARAIDYVVNSNDIDNVRVINISFSGSGEADGCLQTAINNAAEHNISVVCSAGNVNTDALTKPSDLDNVISVIATTTNERWVNVSDQTVGSGYGAAKDVAAPGYFIKTVSTDMDSYGTTWCTGTSFSAPIVSGVLALMYAANPELTVEEAENYLESTATDLGEEGFDNEFANGLVNAKAAVLAVAPEDVMFTRLAGNYAINTMEEIVAEGYLNGKYGEQNGSDTVIIATMDSYYDALTASGLAGIIDCPILLTDPASLSSETAALIEELGATKAYIVGGTSAVSQEVENQVSALSGINEIERLSGNYARDTAMTLYEEGARVGEWGDTAIVCTVNSYLDGLAASPYSFAKNAPIFLVNSDFVLDNSAVAAIANGEFSKVIIMGGTAAVSPAVGTQLFGVVENISRMAGDNAYETARLFANRCLQDGMVATGAALTTAGSYYDALSAGTLCGRANAPLLYVDEGYASSAQTFFTNNVSTFVKGYVLGGYAAVSQEVVQNVKAAIAAAM